MPYPSYSAPIGQLKRAIGGQYPVRPPAAPRVPNPYTAAPRPASAPRTPSAFGGGGYGYPQAPSQPFGHDSTYFTQLAKLNFQAQQGTAQLQRQQQYAKQDYKLSLERAKPVHAQNVLDTNQTANRQGLFYSGTLENRLSGPLGVNTKYAQWQADQRRMYLRATQERSAAINAIRQGLGIDRAALAAQEAGRRFG